MQNLINWWQDRHKRKAAKWLREHGWCPVHDCKMERGPYTGRYLCDKCLVKDKLEHDLKRDKTLGEMRTILKGIDGN